MELLLPIGLLFGAFILFFVFIRLDARRHGGSVGQQDVGESEGRGGAASAKTPQIPSATNAKVPYKTPPLVGQGEENSSLPSSIWIRQPGGSARLLDLHTSVASS